MTSFEGLAAIVTGASRGIGLATAASLLERGASVCLTAREADGLQRAAASLGTPERVVTVDGDSADAGHREAAVSTALERFGSVDLLVNNIGTNGAYGPLMESPLDAVRATLDTNVVAALGWTIACHEAWMKEHGGAIVNVTSVAGLRPATNIGAYGMSKAALDLMTEQLALELGPKVRVNAVAPAVVKTKFARALYEDREDEVASGYPLRRLGRPEDVAGVVTFLLSDEAAWVSGETVVVDGGQMVTGGVEA